MTSPGVFDATAQPVAGQPPSTAGQTLHGDHAYVFYQVPVRARRLPLVMWHGIGQFSKTWETTPDGREGYQTIFLRRGFGVYVVDQPRRGRAGEARSMARYRQHLMSRTGSPPSDSASGPTSSRRAVLARSGGSQPVLPPDDTERGPIDSEVNANAIAALFSKIGPGILVTHSHSGGMGWRTAIKSQNVRAIVSYEPGSGFVFPEGEVPPPVPSSGERWLPSAFRRRISCS